jgi:hypothetical protein
MNKRLAIFLMVSLMVMGLTQVVMAITAPTSGSFAYDMYDIVVNKMLKGPVGFVAGLAAIAFGAVNLIQARIMAALPAILGGALLIKADTVTSSLGLVL